MPSEYSRSIPERRAGWREMFFQDFTWFRKGNLTMAKLKGLTAKVEPHHRYKTPHQIYDIKTQASGKSPRKIADATLKKIAGDLKINNCQTVNRERSRLRPPRPRRETPPGS